MKKDLLDVSKLPAQDFLEQRFHFIQDDILRENIVICFRYIIFLTTIEAEYNLPGTISYSLYKDIISYTAHIIESCLHYCLREFIAKGKIKEKHLMGEEWVEISTKVIHQINKTKRVSGVLQEIKPEKFTNRTQFIIVNRVALKAKILTPTLFKDAELFREQRNKIHLAGLSAVDDIYDKGEVEEFFHKAKKILDRIESKLSTLP